MQSFRRRVPRWNFACAREQITGAVAHHAGLLAVLERHAVDDDQTRQPHCLHRTRRRADIAGGRGLDEYDCNIAEVRRPGKGQHRLGVFLVRLSHRSRMMVTGPSLTSSTSMIAAKRPSAIGRLVAARSFFMKSS